MKKVLLIASLAIFASAQEADIYVISDQEARKAADIWMKLKVAEADWAAFKEEIRKTYRMDCEVAFSRDLKAIAKTDKNCRGDGR